MGTDDAKQRLYNSRYKLDFDSPFYDRGGSCSRILKEFRLSTLKPNEDHRKILTEHFEIRAGLITELYDVHKRCRRQLARVELRIYYQLIPNTIRALSKSITVDRPRPWDWSTLIGVHDNIAYVNRREELLQVRSPRAEQFRQEVKKLQAKSREYERKRRIKQEKEWEKRRQARMQRALK